MMMMMMMMRKKVASNWVKIEYDIAYDMGMDELGTAVPMSKVLWVCESSEVQNFVPRTPKNRLHIAKTALLFFFFNSHKLLILLKCGETTAFVCGKFSY